MGGTILVTGATGTVGSEIVKQLSSAGQKVRTAVHSATRVPSNGKLKHVERVTLDYNKPETLVTAFKDIDKLFLLTPSSPKAAEFAANLVKEAKKAGIRRIVKQSVLGADSELDVAHLRLHRQAEKMIEESGIPFTFLRPNDFMQNFVNFYSPTIKSNNALYLPAEDAKVSFVDVSEEDTRVGLKAMGWDDWLVNTTLQLFDLYRKGYASRVSSEVEEILGRRPTSFTQFAKDYAQVFR